MLARIANDSIAEQRDIKLSDVPEHKREQWRPVEGERPACDDQIETISGPVYVIEPTRVLRQWTVTPRDLEPTRNAFLARLDADAENIRLRYITTGAGMSLVYQEKFAQAQAVSAMGKEAANALSKEDREAQFPTLAASVGTEAAGMWECAELVLARHTQFAALSLHIERARLAGKAAIKSASTVQSVREAYGAVAWPIP